MYVVISIDPAGGGTLSEEAFVVFLVNGGTFGLLTARLIPGHNERYGFSACGDCITYNHRVPMVPLVFVLALRRTILAVRQLLENEWRHLLPGDRPFVPLLAILAGRESK